MEACKKATKGAPELMDKEVADLLAALVKDGIRIEVGGQQFVPKRVIPTGSFLLDWMLGIGGIPSGRLIELAGDEGGGKTTLSMVCAASVLRHGFEVVWVDAEHSFDQEMAENIGARNVIVTQPRYGEEALTVVRRFVKSEKIGLIVIDSIAALVPKAEMEIEFAADQVASQARMLSLKLRQIFADMDSNSPTVVLVNQVRDRVGQVWGDTTTTPGGRSPKHWAHIRIRVGKGSYIEEDRHKIGRIAHLSYLKSKMTSPDKTVDIPLLWGKGIDRKRDAVEAGILTGLVTQEHGYYSFAWDQDAKKVHYRNIGGERLEQLNLKLAEVLHNRRLANGGAKKLRRKTT